MAQSAILNKDYILSKTGYTEEEIDQLEKLDLSNLDLTSIEPDAFLHFHSLKELHLNNNLLTELHSDVFKPLINLEKLYLDHNELTELHPFLFKGLTSLKIVHIFSNKFAAETIDLYLEPNVQVFIFKSGPEENENDDLFNNITDVVNQEFRSFFSYVNILTLMNIFRINPMKRLVKKKKKMMNKPAIMIKINNIWMMRKSKQLA
jgi:Leucine-rich repeat (LRR) protein